MIIYQLESKWFTEKYLNLLKCALLVLEYSLENIPFLLSHDIPMWKIMYLPIGTSTALLQDSNITNEVNRHIRYDILFYGVVNKRRQLFLDEIKKDAPYMLHVFHHGLHKQFYQFATSKVLQHTCNMVLR